MITAQAPGKLFIAGEYAVVEPGQPAVLAAVDRHLTVELTESADAGSVHSDEYGRLPLVWTRDRDGVTVDRAHHPYDYVLAAISIVERLRAEVGVAPRFSDLRISSQLDDSGGRKFGLGSSAAVTVATVAALDEFHGLGLTRMERFRLALLATIAVSPIASGGDVAASTFGGWIGYRSPDRGSLLERLERTSVAAMLTDEWPGLEVTRIQPPASLRLLVGWTGEPASTERLVDRVQQARRDRRADHDAFVAESAVAVGRLVDGLADDDVPTTLEAIGQARRLLRRLGSIAGLSIETPRLAALCDAAERAGAAAKPSGAGGGDCGIVLAPEHADLVAMHRAWETHDVRFLTIGTCPPSGAIDG